MAGVDAFALLVEELKSEEITDQLTAAKKISTIALGMGAEKSKSQLVPYLLQIIETHTDEVLHAVAESIPSLIPAIGGGDSAHVLLPSLEALAEKDETIVRTKAVASLVTVAAAMGDERVQNEMLPLVKRLAGGENFPSRISAAGLFASVYPSSPPALRPTLRKQYETLAKDEMPMVRSAAFSHMPALAKVMEKDVLVSELVPLFNELSTDLQESVREMAVANVVAMVQRLTPDEALKLFGAFSDNLQEDRSAAIRVLKAQHFVSLAAAMNPARPIREQAGPYLQLLVQDNDLDVRTAAAKNLADFCARLDAGTLQSQIIPVLQDLSQPPPPGEMSLSQAVREHIAEHVCTLAAVLGREGTSNDLMRLLRIFLGDDELKAKVLATVDPVVEALGGEGTQSVLLPEVIKMKDDPLWRVRLSIVQTLPVYAKHMGMDLFDQQLKEVQLSALQDSVSRIREQAVTNLEALAKLFGDSWISTHVLPWVLEAAKGNGPFAYQGRISSLDAVEHLLCASSGNRQVCDVLLQKVVEPLSRDRVANVRIASAAALKNVAKRMMAEDKGFVNDVIKPMLQTMAQDAEPDVKIFAETGLSM